MEDGTAEWYSRVPDSVPSGPAVRVRREDLENPVDAWSIGGVPVRRVEGLSDHPDLAVAVEEYALPDDQYATDRFERAVEAWEGFDDAVHVPRVLGWGTDPVGWVATAYPEGGALVQREPPLSDPETLWVGLAVARGVEAGHDAGRLHRALVPSSVGLYPTHDEGWAVPMVGDWIRGDPELPWDPVEAAPEYAAPEQVDPHRFGDPDERTDVYRVGAVLYEVLTGRPPFEGSTQAVLDAVTEDRPTHPEAHVGNPTYGLSDIVARSLATDPDDRQASVGALRSELEGLISPMGSVFRRRARRRRALKILAGSAAVGVGLVGTYVAYITANPVGQVNRTIPTASFDFDYTADSRVVEIVHQGGDTYDRENTSELRYGVPNETVVWPLPVSAGDRVTVEDVAGGDRVWVVWKSDNGEVKEALAEFDVPRPDETEGSTR